MGAVIAMVDRVCICEPHSPIVCSTLPLLLYFIRAVSVSVTFTVFPPFPLHYAQRLNSSPRNYFPLLSRLNVLHLVFRRVVTNRRRRHPSESVLSLSVAGLPASPAPSRYDASGMKSSSWKRVPISSACVQPLFLQLCHLLTLCITQPSKYRGIRMPPNMTKVFNYWGMRDKVDEIGVVTGRVIMSRRTRYSPHFSVTASLRFCTVETAYLLGIHCWEREMLQEAGGEFIALCVRAPCIVLFDVLLSNSAWPSP